MDQNVIKKIMDVIEQCQEGYFAYMDSKGFPHVATRSKITSHDISSFFFSSNTSGSFVSSLKDDSRSSVCFRRGNDNITLIGHAAIVEDQSKKDELWLDWFINHYPGGPTDPEYAIIRFDTKELSLWIDHQVIKADMESIGTI